jgi:hypothetical protein
VHAVFDAAASRDAPEQVRHALAIALAGAGAAPLPIDVLPCEAIEREAGHAAKLKLIKRVD